MKKVLFLGLSTVLMMSLFSCIPTTKAPNIPGVPSGVSQSQAAQT